MSAAPLDPRVCADWVTPSPMDKALVRARYRRSLPRYDREAAVQQEMAASLLEALGRLGRTEFARVLEVGCGTGLLSRQLVRRFTVGELHANDLNEDCGARFDGELGPGARCAVRFLPGDIERVETFPGDLDLVVSNAVFHWLEEPEALLDRLARALVRGGCLAFSTFGPGNLLEVGEITGVRLAYRSADQLRGLLARHFRLRHVSERTVRLRFDSPRAALEHLRRTGANCLARAAWTKGTLRAFEEEYRRRFPLPGGAVSLSYHPLLFVAER